MMRKLHGSVAWLVMKEIGVRPVPFWRERSNRDYFDGCLRDVLQARRAYRYTLLQAVRAGLVRHWREYPHTRVNVAGRIRVGADPRTFYRRVAQPSLFLGYTLKQLLERRGIAIGVVKVGKSPAQGLRVLAAHDSSPLASGQRS